MALFGDKNKQTIEELENYYSNKEQKTGMAWVMAFLSLLLTVVILGGLFFGGRAVYRALSDDGTTETATNETSNTDGNTAQPTPEASTPAPAPSSDSTSASPTPAPAPAPTTSGVVSDQAASTNTPSSTTAQGGNNPAPQGTSTANNQTSGAVAGRSTALPNTGSGPILITAPLIALFAGYFVARKKLLKNQ